MPHESYRKASTMWQDSNAHQPRRAIEPSQPRVAVCVPCYNEAVTIAKVVEDFRAAIPGADIYVFDNNSSDNTAQVARDAGAIVRTETRQGKGHVVRRMFADVEADIYIMVDGDDTYDATICLLYTSPSPRDS